MKRISVAFAILMALMLTSANASALSIEQKDTTNSDGTPKFADPDEQTPPLLAMPNNGSGNNVVENPSAVVAPSMPQMLGADQNGQQAFDRAYAHLQNK
jgi:hypothetical protein